MNNTIHPLRGSDVEMSSQINGTREVALVCGIGACVSFEMYETVRGVEYYEGRTTDGKQAYGWLDAAE